MAGDILAKHGPPERYAEGVIATGYLALTRRYAGASFPYEMWYLTMEDAIETTGRTFMALTLRCARCHDHKFDPVTSRDYYAMYGIFASTKFAYAGSEMLGGSKSPGRMAFVALTPPEQAQPRLVAYQRGVQSLEEQMAAFEKNPVLKPVAELDEKIAFLENRVRRNKSEGLYPETEGLAPADQSDYRDLKGKREAAMSEILKSHPEAAGLPARLMSLRTAHTHLLRPGLPEGLAGAYAVQEGESTDVHVQLSEANRRTPAR